MKIENLYLTAALCLALRFVICPSIASAHEFEDGYVEQSLSVSIQDRVAIVEYSVGCNPQTMKSWMDIWNGVAKLPFDIDSSSQPDSETEDSVAKENCLPNTGLNESALANDQALSSSPADGGPNTADKQQKATKPEAPQPLTKEELIIESDFRLAIERELVDKLAVTCNGTRLEISVDSVELSPRHHVNAVARLKFQIPDVDKASLTIVDKLFPTGSGNARYSLKPRGGAILSKSNVAPILIRAPRHEFAEKSDGERCKFSFIECELTFVSSSTKQ